MKVVVDSISEEGGVGNLGEGVMGVMIEEKGGNLGEGVMGVMVKGVGEGVGEGVVMGKEIEGWIMHEKHEKNNIKKTYKKNIGKKHKIIDIQSDF